MQIKNKAITKKRKGGRKCRKINKIVNEPIKKMHSSTVSDHENCYNK